MQGVNSWNSNHISRRNHAEGINDWNEMSLDDQGEQESNCMRLYAICGMATILDIHRPSTAKATSAKQNGTYGNYNAEDSIIN